MFGPRRSLLRCSNVENDSFLAAQSFVLDVRNAPLFIGRFTQLLDISSPYLSEIIYISRGKGDKMFVVEEHGLSMNLYVVFAFHDKF
jgi:hypothetical protein